jgi:hypothetical protein
MRGKISFYRFFIAMKKIATYRRVQCVRTCVWVCVSYYYFRFDCKCILVLHIEEGGGEEKHEGEGEEEKGGVVMR